MAFSSTVSAGNTALASQYNNLRKDVLDTTGGHSHSGVDSRRISAYAFSYLSGVPLHYNFFMGIGHKTSITGDYNLSIGDSSGLNLSTGVNNTIIGQNAGKTISAENNNTAIGQGAMLCLSGYTGADNIAIGVEAGAGVTGAFSGSRNVLLGNYCGRNITTGEFNIAVGYESLLSDTSGYQNTAIGHKSLRGNITGHFNTALGYNSMLSATGSSNTAIGLLALSGVTGNSNTAIGNQALNSVTSGSNNVGVGNNAQVPVATNSNQVRIGNTSISYAGVQVAWTITSDRAFKENIKKSDLGLDFINELKPVKYNRKNDDKKKIEYGIIAQDLEKVLAKNEIENAGMLLKDDNNKLHLRYNDLIPILIKAVQEQSKEIQELKKCLKK